MAEKKGCSCGGGKTPEGGGAGSPQSCGGGCGMPPDLYWCETCRRGVPDKRCPLCGQKARRSRPGDGG